jgi:hypothetical protein
MVGRRRSGRRGERRGERFMPAAAGWWGSIPSDGIGIGVGVGVGIGCEVLCSDWGFLTQVVASIVTLVIGWRLLGRLLSRHLRRELISSCSNHATPSPLLRPDLPGGSNFVPV